MHFLTPRLEGYFSSCDSCILFNQDKNILKCIDDCCQIVGIFFVCSPNQMKTVEISQIQKTSV